MGRLCELTKQQRPASPSPVVDIPGGISATAAKRSGSCGVSVSAWIEIGQKRAAVFTFPESELSTGQPTGATLGITATSTPCRRHASTIEQSHFAHLPRSFFSASLTPNLLCCCCGLAAFADWPPTGSIWELSSALASSQRAGRVFVWGIPAGPNTEFA